MTFDVNRATTVKSQLAKLLASENISIRHVMGTATASFDVKARILRLPVWTGISEDLYDMLVVHEVGHALYTPADLWITELERLAEKHNPKPGNDRALAKTRESIHSFCNIVEDVRVDIMQRKRYPGSKRNYVIGYKDLFDRDFFRTSKMPIPDMSFINRLNIYSKAGFSGIVIPFTDEEKILVKRTQETVTFEDVIALAEELWLAKLHEAENSEGEENQPSKGEKSEDDSEGEGQESEDDSEGEGQESEDDSEGEGQESEDDSEGEGEGEENQPSKGEKSEDDSEGEGASDNSDDSLIPPEAREAMTAEKADALEKSEKNESVNQAKRPDGHFGGVGSQNKNPEDYLPKAETDEAFHQNVDSLAQSDGCSYYYSTIPEVRGEPWTDYKVYLEEHRRAAVAEGYSYNFDDHQKYLNTFKIEENQAISFMVKEFEMRKSASAYQKSLTAKTGVINTNKLHSYVFTDDIFKRNTVVPTGKNHGFVMFIDWSGSMSSNILNTTRQLLSLCLFCKRIAVPFEVYTFTSNGYVSSQNNDETKGFVKTSESLQLDAAHRIRNILSSRMKVRELNEAMLYLVAMARTETMRLTSGVPLDFAPYRPDCDRMSGTPLNETIIIAEKIVKKFQRQAKIEITNVIFLTDGEGASPALGGNEYAVKSKEYAILIQDPVTREEYMLPPVSTPKGGRISPRYSGNTGWDWTNMLLKVLKNRTKCNLVGFYLLDRGSNWNSIVFQGKYYSPSDERAARSIWKTTGYTPIQNSGYDEYYLISSRAMQLDQVDFGKEEDDSGQIVSKEMTHGKIASAFKKHMGKKTTNRVLLSNFIKKIT